MSAPAKFLFDTQLDAPAGPPAIAHSDVEAMKSIHRAELERVREEALAQGRAEGRLETEKSLERELFRMLDQLVQDTQAQQVEINTKLHDARKSSVLLAMTIAKKLAGSLLARYPAEHIEQFFRDSLSLLPDENAIRLHVAPGLAPALQPRLQALLERNGQENALMTVEDATIEGVTCRLEWKNGGIEQNMDQIYTHIEKMIETCLYSHAQQTSETQSPPDPEPEPSQVQSPAAEPSETEPATDIARPTI